MRGSGGVHFRWDLCHIRLFHTVVVGHTALQCSLHMMQGRNAGWKQGKAGRTANGFTTMSYCLKLQVAVPPSRAQISDADHNMSIQAPPTNSGV